MNLPNKLTLLRILMIPLFVAVFYIPYLTKESLTLLSHEISLSFLIGVIIFSIAAFTDFLDGNLARKYNQVTTFGKFMDPLADKLLVMSALLMALEYKLVPGYVAIIILAREFMVTGIRLLAVGEGNVIAASSLGKVKTISQIVMIIGLFILPPGKILIIILIVIATVLTAVSGIDYFMKNKTIVFASK